MSKTVITWGRMNPPTVGHQKLVDKVKAEAKKRGAMPHVFIIYISAKFMACHATQLLTELFEIRLTLI